MQIPAAVRNVLIIFGIAALVVLIPGGGTGASVAIQAVSILFLGSIAWFASIMYRQHRIELDSLGDRKRAILYGALAVALLTITATSRLWHAGGAGIIAWFALVGGAAYAVFAVIWAARQY
jgi:uncharacterized membrane protein (DUF4010 family)